LRALSQLIKVWRFAYAPPLFISSFYLDALLATSQVGVGVKSYGQCMNEFFDELIRRELQPLSDPAGISEGILAGPASEDIRRARAAAKTAVENARAALAAQARGAFHDANAAWEAIFGRRLAPRGFSFRRGTETN
jgi:hypothetical protein